MSSVKWLIVQSHISIIFVIFGCLVSLMLDSDCNRWAMSRISCMAPIMVPVRDVYPAASRRANYAKRYDLVCDVLYVH
jgi:hypothetical protein